MARTATEIADRWVEHFSTELGGAMSSFNELSELATGAPDRLLGTSLVPPSLDELLDVILDSSRGRAIGTDAIPIEVIQVGGLPAASLVHSLILACWAQTRSPLRWKGGVVFVISQRAVALSWIVAIDVAS